LIDSYIIKIMKNKQQIDHEMLLYEITQFI